MSFELIPVTTAGPISVHADGVMVTAADSSVGMYFTWDDIDAAKDAADGERKAQVREGRRPAVVTA